MQGYFYWILGVLLVLTWVIRPLFVFVYVMINMHAKQALDADAPAKVVDPQTMTPEARQQLEMLSEQFIQEGFNSIGPAISYQSKGMAIAVEKTLVNSNGDIAMVIVTTAALARSHAFVVRSKLESGKEFSSTFARSAGVIPSAPNVDSINFGWMQNAHELCEVHRRRMAKLQLADAKRIAPTPVEHLSHSRDERNRELQNFQRTGYMYLDPTRGAYRYTWKGALLMSLKLGRRVKQWRAWRQDKRARVVWHDVGMDDWQKSIATASPLDVASKAASSEVAYQPQLPEGEVNMHSADGVLTVRIGVETTGQYLARQWLSIFIILFFSLLIASLVYMMSTISGQKPGESYLYLLGGIVIVAVQSWLLLIGAMRRRGTIVLVASQRGLSYRNTPQRRPDGQLLRGSIQAMLVVLGKFTMRGKTFHLILFPRLQNKMILATHSKKEQLDQIRQALLETMGVDRPAEQAHTDAIA